MRFMTVAGGVAILMACTSWLAAEELQSGVEVDGRIGAYRTTKVCGAEDGVDDGKSLCYT